MATDSEKLALIEQLDRAIEAKNRVLSKAKDEASIYLHAAETAATAGLIGFVEARTGRTNVVDGIGIDFAVAAAGFGFGFFGAGKKLAEHCYAVGAGGLGVYAYKWGRDMGARLAQPKTASSGLLPEHGGLSDAELQRLVSAARSAV